MAFGCQVALNRQVGGQHLALDPIEVAAETGGERIGKADTEVDPIGDVKVTVFAFLLNEANEVPSKTLGLQFGRDLGI